MVNGAQRVWLVACLALIACGAAGWVMAQSPVDAGASASDTTVGRTLEAPTDNRPLAQKFWWSDDWWQRGVLPAPANHGVVRRQLAYRAADGTEVPATLYRPDGPARHPAVLFAHGRRGLDEETALVALRMAARGFAVLAPDLHAARFVGAMPVGYDPASEGDLAAGLDALLALPDVATRRACLLAHTRGGYAALKVAVTRNRQRDAVACLVAYYPHLQHPAAGEPDQVYRHAAEVDRLELPTLMFMGEYEQYQRRRSIETAVLAMRGAGRNVRLVTYPGVGRAFEFRGAQVRTFADDLAAKDANQRAAEFMLEQLRPWMRP